MTLVIAHPGEETRIISLRRRDTGEILRRGATVETHSGQRYWFERVDGPETILVAPEGPHHVRRRRVRGFAGVELVVTTYAGTDGTPTYRGKCCDCGDEWVEDTEPAICPECHSLNVVELP